tara:strand:- start:7795 stop:9030 length:1236 start_codon:yes stop_codon:yes gene_type:complete
MIRILAVSTILPEQEKNVGEGDDLCTIRPIAHRHVRLGSAFVDDARITADLQRYRLGPHVIRRLSRSGALAVAAGMRALEDASLVSEASGWTLPEHLQDNVGVVFASSFGHCEPALMPRQPVDAPERKLALDLCLQANVQIAEHVKARAFNTFSSAACASTTVALKVACNAIAADDCTHCLVVAADAVLSNHYTELVASFVNLNAATATETLEGKTAFAKERGGFVFGEGAVAMLLANDGSATSSSSVPLVRLITSRIGNSAYHGTRVDVTHVTKVLRKAVEETCRKCGINRSTLARHCLYVSHETATRLCANAEVSALRAVFGDDVVCLVITNTKAFSGHIMGASVEDAVAVVALQQQRAPAVDVAHLDSTFHDLTFSDGAPRRYEYAIHVAYGLGSHVAVCVYGTTLEE